jgi:acetyl esterase/lipase
MAETWAVSGSASRSLAVDVYRPANNSQQAAVLLLHGGGWVAGDRRAMAPYADELARRGYTAIAVEYRLSPEAIWPAPLIDVRAAFNWVAGHADRLGIDPQRIALQGFSAGGHLALMAASAAVPEYPLHRRAGAVIALFAPAELHLPPPAAGPNPARLLLGPDADAEDARQASPLTHIAAAFPPTYLLNGTRDPLVSCDDALKLFARFMAVGAAADLHLFQGQTHEFAELPRLLPTVQANVAAFLDRVMVDPAGYDSDNLRLNKFMNPDFMRALAPAGSGV